MTGYGTEVVGAALPAQSPVTPTTDPGAAAAAAVESGGEKYTVSSTAAAPAAATPAPSLGEPNATASLDSAPRAQTLSGLTPEQYPDLFDRIRAGFKLDELDSRQIDNQLSYYANHPEYLERVFGRAELYLHHIVAEVEARGMPLEIALLPVVESAFEPYAMSGARAYGLWQFIPGTGERFGLKRNWWYDGRRDVIASTRAALDYLQYMHDEFFGDWLLAIAGYNCGEYCVQRAVKANRAAGLPVDFFSLKLPAETRAYVPKLLAMRRLVANPEDYGIEFSPIANEPYFVKVETGGQVDLKLAADLAGITPEELYELNPGFHRWATDPAGPHALLLPYDSADVFREGLAVLTPDERLRVTWHTVNPGESLATIARRTSTQTQMIREMNNLRDRPLVVGSQIRIPSGVTALPPKVMKAAARVDGGGGGSMRRSGKRPVVHVVRRGDSLWRIAKRHRMDVRTLARLNGIGPAAKLRTGQRLVLASGGSTTRASNTRQTASSSVKARKLTYKVRRGDTLSHIARVFDVSVAELVSWNGITPRATLRPGQKITVNVRRR